ncbi:hypothetical protein BJ138DRAFT_1120887 [Hygrophoropsis aurantiaca]|uniref:Uncharacterized protein n=1 Tax=Hygrophoropsis aurantiaca TaxID=72124 RepID=A0ACB7ZRJ9_9AGAM|nr:hypothetical protein BJ138DRAFT_1120887 [Hygrophoropsis aurantiaca]
MKVETHNVLTFTVRELEAALELVKTQNEIFTAHENDLATAPGLLANSECPACYLRHHRLHCGVCGIKIEGTDNDHCGLGAIAMKIDESEEAKLCAQVTHDSQQAAMALDALPPAPDTPAPDAPPTAPVVEWAVGKAIRWYAVTVGLEVGVYEGWPIAHRQVVGVSGSCYTYHRSRAAAEAAFSKALDAGAVTTVTM